MASPATRVPARPAAAVPARPAAAPQPGKANIPAAAQAPVSTNTNPIAGISTNDGANGAQSAPQVAVNQPGNTVAPVAGAELGGASTVGQQTSVPSELVGGATELVAPVATETKKRRGRKPGSGKSGAPKKLDYPGLFLYDNDGNPIMEVEEGEGKTPYHKRAEALTAVPTDFDFSKYNKLKSSDFANEAVFCDFMATRFESLMKNWQRKAKRIRALGTAGENKKALKYIKMREEMAKLQEQLAADGMDISVLDMDGEETETTVSAE